MEAIIARIKGYVLVIYPTILSDLGISDAFLNLMIESVVDRALVFMNRAQLVAQYEEDLVDPNVDSTDYVLPIPRELEKVLASVVVSVCKTVKTNNTADTGAIKRVQDNGQEIEYTDAVTTFLSTSSDTDIFAGSVELMRRYLIPTIVNNDYTKQFPYNYWR